MPVHNWDISPIVITNVVFYKILTTLAILLIALIHGLPSLFSYKGIIASIFADEN